MHEPRPDPRPRRTAARRPRSPAEHALALARWLDGDPSVAVEALEAGCACKPNDAMILADLGQRYATLARWDEAVPPLERADAANPRQPGSDRDGRIVHHFTHRRCAEALAEARRLDAPEVLCRYGAVTVAAMEPGLKEEAGDGIAAIWALDSHFGTQVVRNLESCHVTTELVPLIVAGLGTARLAVTAAAVSAS